MFVCLNVCASQYLRLSVFYCLEVGACLLASVIFVLKLTCNSKKNLCNYSAKMYVSHSI